jgi:hypothetical protein
MNADAAATDSATRPITQPPQNSYPRSSAAKYSCLRRQPVRPRPPPAQRSTRPGPPGSGTPRPINGPPAPSPATVVQIHRRNPYAQSAERSPHRCPSSHPAPRPEANPPTCQPPRHAPPEKRICPPQPVRPEHPPHPTTPPAGHPTPFAIPHLLAATRTPRETSPHRTTPPAGQLARSANPYPPAATPYAQRNRALPPPHLRALRALRGGSTCSRDPAPSARLQWQPPNATHPETGSWATLPPGVARQPSTWCTSCTATSPASRGTASHSLRSSVSCVSR